MGLTSNINNIVVIGSGVMGSNIAAHITNSGMKVTLLDIASSNANDKNAFARLATEKMKEPGNLALTDPSNVDLITIGNLEDDFDLLKDADLIIEAIVEKLEIKQFLYKRIEKVKKPDAIVSSNTSTICLKELIAGLGDNFRQHFCITHFFNPPRYLKLLELITGEETLESVNSRIREFCDKNLGRNIVVCKDAPGFIANRIGCYWLEVGLTEAVKLDMHVDNADIILSTIAGIPKTGIFGLYDLIGLDVMELIVKSLIKSLPSTDELVKVHAENVITPFLVEKGLFGRKIGAGFYRMKVIEGQKIKETLDLKLMSYRKWRESVYTNLNFDYTLESQDKLALYCFSVMSKTLLYVAKVFPEMADDIYSVDKAMKYGYNWQYGPFELLDLIGVKKLLARLGDDIEVPPLLKEIGDNKFYQGDKYYHRGNYIPIPKIELENYASSSVILKNKSASIYNIGDNIAGIEFNSKMSMANTEILEMLCNIENLEKIDVKGVVIGGTGKHFCVGGNLDFMLENAKKSNWDTISSYIKLGQQAMKTIKYSSIPVVSALRGVAFGGGCEILLHSNAISAYIESTVGLVETKVGLIPAWGGIKEMILRYNHNLLECFKYIINAETAGSIKATESKFKFENLAVVANLDYLLQEAKELASQLNTRIMNKEFKSNALSKDEIDFYLSTRTDLSKHDLLITELLSSIFTKNLTEDEIYALEHDIFMELIKTQKTQERIEHMLTTGKALRN